MKQYPFNLTKLAVAIPTALFFSGVVSPTSFAATVNSNQKNIEEVVVTGVRERLYQAGMLKDVIQKTEIINTVNIEKANAVTLTEAIAESPGIRVNNECSMCGVKRVMLNGLRGEHTTVLVDGIPIYTMLSGFYGLDAAATAGLERIEIARGAGASLTAPEAIGGTLNMISKVAKENGGELDVSLGENGYKKASIVGTVLANEDTTRLTVVGQFDDRDEFDGDNNGVSENPALENKVLTTKLSQDIGQSDNLEVRASLVESEIFGGPTGKNINTVKSAHQADDSESAQLFTDGDVRKRYIGKSWETAEWIKTDRRELSLNWLHEFSSDWNMNLILADVVHEQDSFYEGFDYKAENTMSYVDLHFNINASDKHSLVVGINSRTEENRSKTSGDNDPNYVSDSFDYDSYGIYIQDTWNATEQLEIAAALRFDQVTADFVDPQKAGTEIDEKIVSPRLDMRYIHNDNWTSRFSAGRGYRAPLSFFESDHGLLDAGLGFDIQVDKLERSLSFNYALSYENEKTSVTSSIAKTTISDLAILDEVTINGNAIPSLQQADEKASSVVFDIAASYQVLDNLSISAVYENIRYNDTFKQAFGVVPIESRINLSADWEVQSWDIFFNISHIGSRDLSKYGAEPSPTFDQAGNFPKSRKADSYWVANMKASKAITDNLDLYIGANNLFDYTQVEKMESPLLYQDGSYDVVDLYGPLRGREAYVGVKWSF